MEQHLHVNDTSQRSDHSKTQGIKIIYKCIKTQDNFFLFKNFWSRLSGPELVSLMIFCQLMINIIFFSRIFRPKFNKMSGVIRKLLKTCEKFKLVESISFLLRYLCCEVLSQVIHAADPPCQLDVAGEQGHSLGVDCAQVGVREQHDEKRLCSLRGAGNQTKETFTLHCWAIQSILSNFIWIIDWFRRKEIIKNDDKK